MDPLNHHTAQLAVTACYAAHDRQQLIEALAAGTTLVVDRYAFSGAAFTAAKGVPSFDLAWCKVRIWKADPALKSMTKFLLAAVTCVSTRTLTLSSQHRKYRLRIDGPESTRRTTCASQLRV